MIQNLDQEGKRIRKETDKKTGQNSRSMIKVLYSSMESTVLSKLLRIGNKLPPNNEFFSIQREKKEDVNFGKK